MYGYYAKRRFDNRFGHETTGTSPCPFEDSNCFVYGSISDRRTIIRNKIIDKETGGMINDVLAEMRKDPSWKPSLEANNERSEKVGQ